MKTFSQYRAAEMQIVQPSIWKRIYELRSSDGTLMTLRYPKWFSSSAIIEGFGERWEIAKPSIWKSTIEIKKQGYQLPFAKFISTKWGKGGTFELPNGGRIQYAFGIWKGTNELFSHDTVRILSMKQTSIWSRAITVSYEHQSELLDNNPWIIMVVYHTMVERRRQSHSGAI